jgi:hypothetical protein
MAMRVFTTEESMKIMELAKSPYRPEEIVTLQKEIEAKTRVAELKASITGEVDGDLVYEIVSMKLQKDNLYAAWVDREMAKK